MNTGLTLLIILGRLGAHLVLGSRGASLYKELAQPGVGWSVVVQHLGEHARLFQAGWWLSFHVHYLTCDTN